MTIRTILLGEKLLLDLGPAVSHASGAETAAGHPAVPDCLHPADSSTTATK